MGVGSILLACGSDDGGTSPQISASETTADTGLPACRDVDRTAVFSVFGAATTGVAGEAAAWVNDPGAEPVARPNAATLASTYRDAGYHILYIVTLPSESLIGDRPVVDAITVWLGVNGFPVGEGARVGARGGRVSRPLRRADRGAGPHGRRRHRGRRRVRRRRRDRVPPRRRGVPNDRVYDLRGGDGEVPPETRVSSTPLPDEDLSAHVVEVEALAPICE